MCEELQQLLWLSSSHGTTAAATYGLQCAETAGAAVTCACCKNEAIGSMLLLVSVGVWVLHVCQERAKWYTQSRAWACPSW